MVWIQDPTVRFVQSDLDRPHPQKLSNSILAVKVINKVMFNFIQTVLGLASKGTSRWLNKIKAMGDCNTILSANRLSRHLE